MEEIAKMYSKILDSIPKEIDFGFIPVKNETKQTFIIENTLKTSIPISIESDELFKFNCEKTSIPRLSRFEIMVTCYPITANVSIGNALVIIGDDKEKERLSKIIKISYISKYPYIKIQKSIFDFGNVLMGKTEETEIILVNYEKVPASFFVKRKRLNDSKNHEEFFLSDWYGVIPPNTQFKIIVKFNANFTNHLSYETYEIFTRGGNSIRFSCIANSLGIRTNINEKFLNFQSVEINTHKTRMIRVFNESDEPTYFQFFYNNEGVFEFDQLQGVIPNNSNVRIRITFKPIETIIYYERIFCLTKNHFLFALDISGSGHDLLVKTKILTPRHLDLLRFKMSNGTFFAPKTLLNYGKDFDITNYLESATKTFRKSAFNRDKERSSDLEYACVDSSSQIQLHKELLWENTANSRIISANVDMIDFRFCEKGKLSEPFSLTITNNSNERIKVKWLLNKPCITSNLTKVHNIFNLENILFIIHPEEAHITRRSSYDFKVYFKPNLVEHYFFTNLTCLATMQTNYEKFDNTKGFESLNKTQMEQRQHKSFTTTMAYKSNLLRNLEKTEKGFEYFDPPIALKINIIGHSFPPHTQIFMPMVDITPKKEIIFQPSTIYQSMYQTLLVRNKSDTPLYYKFMNDITNIFRVFPKMGLVPPKNFNLILIEFCPKENKSYSYPLKVVFNHELHSMQTVMLHGYCCDPLIEIENLTNDEIYFSPSFTGISTTKTLNIINKSPIKINIQINNLIYNNTNPNDKSKSNNNNTNSLIMIKSGEQGKKTQERVKIKEKDKDEDNNHNKPKNSKLALMNLKSLNSNNTNTNDINEKDNQNTQNINSNTNLKHIKKMNSSITNSNVNQAENENENVDNIDYEKINTSMIHVQPNYLDLEPNQIHKLEISFCPLVIGEIENKIELTATRIYDPLQELQGVYNPGFNQNRTNEKFDKRTYKKIVKILGKGKDGDLKISPNIVDFGTVKVGFEKKKSFSIYNPSICNFYCKLEFDEDSIDRNSLKLDFNEGYINSLCRKDVNISFNPKTRANIQVKLYLYACENPTENLIKTNYTFRDKDNNNNNNFETKNLKAEITIKANGDYPLLKICDIRNANIGITHLWNSFNVDTVNEEILKPLTEEELLFVNNEKTKLTDYYSKLKLISFNFGKYLLKKKTCEMGRNTRFMDIFLTFKNVGGVACEFFFRFPHDISIKREPWMDEQQTSNNETREYQILKHNLFDIYPRHSKLEPGELVNIRMRYDVKEIGEHKLRVIFQIVNGKPIIFELYGETHLEKKGILEIRNRNLDFSYAPMGYMMPIVCPLEIKNIGGIKLRYRVIEEAIKKFNMNNDDFEIFKLENIEGPLSPGETTYIIGSFRPLTNKYYKVEVPLEYTDGNNTIQYDFITLTGNGYNPRVTTVQEPENKYKNIPKFMVYNNYENEFIQKCGFSLEELDFGTMDHSKSSSEIFILYNYSKTDYFNYEFFNPGFNMSDELTLEPSKGRLEPNSHIIIKAKLVSTSTLSNYLGEIECVVSWVNQGDNRNVSERETLYIRVYKKAKLRELPGKIEQTVNQNISFVEEAIIGCFKELFSDEEFDNILSKRIDEIPCGLFEWTNDIHYPTHEEVRNKMINTSLNKAIANLTEPQPNDRNTIRRQTATRQNISQQSEYSRKEKEKEREERRARIAEEYGDHIFNDAEDAKIDDKYYNEVINKNCYTINEVNEKMIVVNENTRNLINTVLESTFNNIISEAIFGETDLSEQTKIFFYKK